MELKPIYASWQYKVMILLYNNQHDSVYTKHFDTNDEPYKVQYNVRLFTHFAP